MFIEFTEKEIWIPTTMTMTFPAIINGTEYSKRNETRPENDEDTYKESEGLLPTQLMKMEKVTGIVAI